MNKFLPVSLALFLALLSGCEKSISHPTRDTALMNLHGNVVQMNQKDYSASKDKDDNFKFGELQGSVEYTFNIDGMITSEKHLDAAGNTTEEVRLDYKNSSKQTVMTTPEGTVTTTRDLNAGTMQQVYRDNDGTLTKTVQLKINKKALPLQATVLDPIGQVLEETLWERDVRGNVTSVTYKREGAITSSKTYVLNKMGDPSQEVETNATDTIATRSYLYNYDQKGNWTRRIIRHMEKSSRNPRHTISERSYSYN